MSAGGLVYLMQKIYYTIVGWIYKEKEVKDSGSQNAGGMGRPCDGRKMP